MTNSRSRPRAILLALAAATALTALIAPAAHAAPVVHAARAAPRTTTCDISGVADRLGPTSVSSLKVLRARCERGISVVRAFHACRLANGPSGRCVRVVRGYACAEIRTSSPTQFSASVTCRKDRSVVTHRYTQNL